MMASRILSRFLPGAEIGLDGQSLDGPVPERHLEAGRSGQDDEQFKDDLDDQELQDMLLDTAAHSIDHGAPLEHVAPDIYTDTTRSSVPDTLSHQKQKQKQPIHSRQPVDDEDIPESLLLESERLLGATILENTEAQPGRTNIKSTDPRWMAAQGRQRAQFERPQVPAQVQTNSTPRVPTAHRIDPREQALWRWANISNVDGFLLEVYQYFMEHGIWSICLARLIYVLTTAFLFGMYMFLSTCVDYQKIPHSHSTSEVLIDQCMKNTSFAKSVALWIFVFWYIWTVFRYATDIRRLWQLHEFFHHLLKIPDTDLQTIPWERVVEGLMSLREANPETADKNPKYFQQVLKATQSKQRMDAHDIANRLMRRDNYYIALINKEILDLTLPLPFVGNRQFYSKSLEWCIGFCFENFIFDDHGHVQQTCLSTKNRQRMIEALRRRFRFAAIISIFMAPFNIGAHCVYYFSRYYAEFRNSPAQLGARAFTPLAEWKMREFNELDHDFRRRMKMAYPFADRYLNQFPKDKSNQILSFVSLVTGTIAAILGIATLLDPELFLGFEVTPGRTAFFYLSVSMGVFAAARNAVPDENEVHEPVLHLFEVIDYTHYCPARWRGQLHSNAIRAEFSTLYQVKILIFVEEILSLVVAPFILWRNSNKQAKDVIDFFRQYTVHVDGLGPLCHHAVFEFRKRKNAEDDDVTGAKDAKDILRDEYYGVGGTKAQDEKMAMSQYYFMQRLGQYDQQSANRYHSGRNYQHVPLPPTFPPLSPLREAADARPTARDRNRSKQPPSRVHTVQTPQHAAPAAASPAQSLLLDLQHARKPRSAGFRSKQNQVFSPPQPAKELEIEDDLDLDLDREVLADLTTSRLIETDRSLGDSWRGDDEEDERVSGPEKGHTNAGGNGVLGLLVEYSKARAGVGDTAPGSGRRGSRIG